MFQLASVLDSNLQWDIKVRGLEVHVFAIHCKGSLWDSQLISVIEDKFTMNIVILACKSLSYSVTVTSSYLVSYLYSAMHDIDACLINLRLS